MDKRKNIKLFIEKKINNSILKNYKVPFLKDLSITYIYKKIADDKTIKIFISDNYHTLIIDKLSIKITNNNIDYYISIYQRIINNNNKFKIRYSVRLDNMENLVEQGYKKTDFLYKICKNFKCLDNFFKRLDNIFHEIYIQKQTKKYNI